MSSRSEKTPQTEKSLYTFTVRTTPETAWEVVRSLSKRRGPPTEEVVFRGIASHQAHAVAQALVYWVEHDRPLQPMQESYPAYPPRQRERMGLPTVAADPKYGFLRLVRGEEAGHV